MGKIVDFEEISSAKFISCKQNKKKKNTSDMLYSSDFTKEG
jgi:hypothetical protein